MASNVYWYAKYYCMSKKNVATSDYMLRISLVVAEVGRAFSRFLNRYLKVRIGQQVIHEREKSDRKTETDRETDRHRQTDRETRRSPSNPASGLTGSTIVHVRNMACRCSLAILCDDKALHLNYTLRLALSWCTQRRGYSSALQAISLLTKPTFRRMHLSPLCMSVSLCVCLSLYLSLFVSLSLAIGLRIHWKLWTGKLWCI